MAARIHQQKKTDKDKLCSYFAPEVSCISKAKSHKKYEFGCKAWIRGFVLQFARRKTFYSLIA
jgi:hypothetical protein